MNKIKKVWVTESLSPFFTLSMESENAEDEVFRIKMDELVFPDIPTPTHPLRHTVRIGTLTEDDLIKVRQAIDRYLGLI